VNFHNEELMTWWLDPAERTGRYMDRAGR
jgi:hypothetical protein